MVGSACVPERATRAPTHPSAEGATLRHTTQYPLDTLGTHPYIPSCRSEATPAQPAQRTTPHTMTIITIDLDDTITIPLGRNSVYGTLDVNVERLPPNAWHYIAMYGLKQVINDSMATKVDKDGNTLPNYDIALKAMNKLDALYAGTLRMRGEAVAADAYEAEAIREAKRHVVAVLSKAGLMKNIPKGTENRMMYAINRELMAKGKPETTEADYLAVFFTTPTGKVIKARAIKTVDDRRADASDMDDLVDLI